MKDGYPLHFLVGWTMFAQFISKYFDQKEVISLF